MRSLGAWIPAVLFFSVLGCADAPSGVEAEIDALFGAPAYGSVNRTEARRMLEVTPEDDRPFYAVTFARHRARAAYPDGRPTDLTGADADALYGDLVRPILADVGAEAIFLGDVERTLIAGDGAGWDRVSVVLYPSRAAFLAMLKRSDHRAAAVHEAAALERAIALVTEPAANQVPEDLRRLDLSALPFPPTASDSPVNVVHLIRFNEIARYADGRATDLTGREALALYEQHRTPQAFPLGVRPGIVLEVEGELIGDGRAWDEVRLNNFPSHAAFAELVRAESLIEAGYEDREAALADTYALLVAPALNRVGYLPP
ncbi:MAG TPA: hypothetical protein VFD92_01175 [Candidatus Binatia bacterium]|nr:hypothetical protein [Candidatus Binatia bacterium]